MVIPTKSITLKPRHAVRPDTKVEDIEWTLPRSSVPEPLVGRISLEEWETTFDAVEERYRFMYEEFDKSKPWMGLSIFSPDLADVSKQSKIHWRNLIRRELERIYEPVGVDLSLASSGTGVKFTLHTDSEDSFEEEVHIKRNGTFNSSLKRETRQMSFRSSRQRSSSHYHYEDRRFAGPQNMSYSGSFVTLGSVMTLSDSRDDQDELSPQNVFDQLHQLEKLHKNGALDQKQYARTRENLWKKIAGPKGGQSRSYFAWDKNHSVNVEAHLDRLHQLSQTGAITEEQYYRARDRINMQLKSKSVRFSTPQSF